MGGFCPPGHFLGGIMSGGIMSGWILSRGFCPTTVPNTHRVIAVDLMETHISTIVINTHWRRNVTILSCNMSRTIQTELSNRLYQTITYPKTPVHSRETISNFSNLSILPVWSLELLWRVARLDYTVDNVVCHATNDPWECSTCHLAFPRLSNDVMSVKLTLRPASTTSEIVFETRPFIHVVTGYLDLLWDNNDNFIFGS